MSAHKNIDIICVAVTVFAVIVTFLLMIFCKAPSTDTEIKKADFDSATKITLKGDSAETDGSGAEFSNGNLYIVYPGSYIISGELNNGSVIIEAKKTENVFLLFDGVTIYCENAPAVKVEKANRVTVTLADGTQNSVASGAAFTDEKEDGTFYSRDDLTFNGNGSLTVNAEFRHGIVCNDDLVFDGGEFDITAKEDTIHANDSVKITDTVLTLNAGDDGITASNDKNTSLIHIKSGKININSCYEGIEACNITVDGGEINISPEDDGLNANSGKQLIEINGGKISVINKNGRDADGFDSNGDIIINGGEIFISVPDDGVSTALDYGSESGGKCEINGGTVAAFGSNGMAEEMSESSKQGFIMRVVSGAGAGSEVTLKNSDGETVFSKTVDNGFSLCIISVNGMQNGDKFTLTAGENTEEITVDGTYTKTGGGNSFMPGGEQPFGGRDDFNPDEEPPEMPNGEQPQMQGGEQPQMQGGEQPPEKPDDRQNTPAAAA